REVLLDPGGQLRDIVLGHGLAEPLAVQYRRGEAGLVSGELVEDRGIPLGERRPVDDDLNALLLGVLVAEDLQDIRCKELEPGDVQGTRRGVRRPAVGGTDGAK